MSDPCNGLLSLRLLWLMLRGTQPGGGRLSLFSLVLWVGCFLLWRRLGRTLSLANRNRRRVGSCWLWLGCLWKWDFLLHRSNKQYFRRRICLQDYICFWDSSKIHGRCCRSAKNRQTSPYLAWTLQPTPRKSCNYLQTVLMSYLGTKWRQKLADLLFYWFSWHLRKVFQI